MALDSRSLAWAMLAHKALPQRALVALLREFGDAERVLAASRAQIARATSPAVADLALAKIDGEALGVTSRWLDDPSHHLIAWDDPDYPQALLELGYRAIKLRLHASAGSHKPGRERSERLVESLGAGRQRIVAVAAPVALRYPLGGLTLRPSQTRTRWHQAQDRRGGNGGLERGDGGGADVGGGGRVGSDSAGS